MLRGAKRRGNPYPFRQKPAKSAEFVRFRNGLPRQCAHWLAMTGFFDSLTPACVSMRAFLQPFSAQICFGKTASRRKRARFVQSRGASPQAYWMSVKAAQRWGCAKRAFCGVCFLMPGGLKRGFFIARFLLRCRGGRLCPPEQREALSFRASDRVTGVGIR